MNTTVNAAVQSGPGQGRVLISQYGMFEAFDEVTVTEVVAITAAVEKGDEVSDEVTENKSSQVNSYTKINCAETTMAESNRFYFAEFRMCRM